MFTSSSSSPLMTLCWLEGQTEKLRKSRLFLLFLGMNIIQYEQEGGIWIGEPIYTNLLRKYSMENSKPAIVPMGSSETFMKSTDLDEQFDPLVSVCNWKSVISLCHYKT